MPKRKQDDNYSSALAECSAVDIKKVMSRKEEAETKCVILRQNGTSVEVSVDMTPSLKKLPELLGGDVTFLGQFESIQVVLLVKRDQEGMKKKDLNKHKLFPPLADAEAFGDIILTRSGDNGEPLDFTIEEWNAYEGEPEGCDDDQDEEEEEEEEVEDEDEDEDFSDEDDPEGDAILDKLTEKAIDDFKKKNGRVPTEKVENMFFFICNVTLAKD